jgi:ribosomal protein L40E
MDCLQCKAQNPGDAVFCENCGSRLEAACPNCGGANWLGAKFCKKCGQRLLESAPASPVTAGKFGSVETYTPKHLAEKILTICCCWNHVGVWGIIVGVLASLLVEPKQIFEFWVRNESSKTPLQTVTTRDS